MRKNILAFVLIAMLLSMSIVSAEPTPGGSYWQEMKTIYEDWKAMDSEITAVLTVNLPNEPEKVFNIHITSKSSLGEFVSWMKLEIETDDLEMVIPTIEMYTNNTDIYINSEAILFFAEMMGMAETFTIEETFVMLQSTENQISLDTNYLMEMLEFIEGMDLDFDLDMTLEDGTYHLSLDSDIIIDLLDTYMLYAMTNMDQLLQLTGQADMLELTEEEMAEAVKAYTQMIAPMLQMAKDAIGGSFYRQSTTFQEDAYNEEVEFFLTTPFGGFTLTMESSAQRLDSVEVMLPTSVKVVTEQDLTELMLSSMNFNAQGQQPAVIIVMDQGLYVQFDGANVIEGQIYIQVSPEGRSYMRAADAVRILGLDIEPTDEMIQIRSFEEHGFKVVWNDVHRLIEIHHQ